MSNYDDLLREKENEDMFNVSSIEKHWAALEQKFDVNKKQPGFKYRELVRIVIAVAAVLIIAFIGYTFLKDRQQHSTKEALAVTVTKSSIAPPLKGADVPYEHFSFDAATGDTIFTLNGSIIIFPKNAVLNSRGEVVTGKIDVRSREFNDPFDYSIAGIPMDYDSAGIKYQFISSGMIDISAYQNGELLKVNPAAKPQLNLVSTNKEIETNLYQLDTASGLWIYKGKDEVNLLKAKVKKSVIVPVTDADVYIPAPLPPINFDKGEQDIKPVAPQKASSLNPTINIAIDPASFKELLVYNGLKFEVLDSDAETVGRDAAKDWSNVELKRVGNDGTYRVIFSADKKIASYRVKPVLEGKDFEAAEKLYQEKLKEYEIARAERKKYEQEDADLFRQKNPGGKMFRLKDSVAMKAFNEENKRVEELNRLMVIRNKFIEEENIRIEAINKENRQRRDSIIKANNEFAEQQRKDFEKQQAIWDQNNRTQALEQNLLRSFEIDGFGYWNCDQPSLPQVQQYVSSFKTTKNEIVYYNTLCIATAGINLIQNYYETKSIGLIPNCSYFGWAFNATQFYYFTKNDFDNASKTSNPNTITVSMNLYEGDVKNYAELKGFIFSVNNSIASNKSTLK
jgi:hypothetical protein